MGNDDKIERCCHNPLYTALRIKPVKGSFLSSLYPLPKRWRGMTGVSFRIQEETLLAEFGICRWDRQFQHRITHLIGPCVHYLCNWQPTHLGTERGNWCFKKLTDKSWRNILGSILVCSLSGNEMFRLISISCLCVTITTELQSGHC